MAWFGDDWVFLSVLCRKDVEFLHCVVFGTNFLFLPLYAAQAVPFYSNASNLVLGILNHGRDKPRIAPFMLEVLSIWSLPLLGKSHEIALKQYTETLH